MLVLVLFELFCKYVLFWKFEKDGSDFIIKREVSKRKFKDIWKKKDCSLVVKECILEWK